MTCHLRHSEDCSRKEPIQWLEGWQKHPVLQIARRERELLAAQSSERYQMTLSSRLLPRPTVPADKSTNFDKAIRGGFSESFFSSWLPSAVSSERRSNIEPPSSACSQPPLEVSNQMQAVEECTFAQPGAQLLGA